MSVGGDRNIITFVIKSQRGLVLHEWDVTQWMTISAEERTNILDEIIALGGIENSTNMKVWLGLRILDLHGAARHYGNAKLSVELPSIRPDPGADTQAIPSGES